MTLLLYIILNSAYCSVNNPAMNEAYCTTTMSIDRTASPGDFTSCINNLEHMAATDPDAYESIVIRGEDCQPGAYCPKMSYEYHQVDRRDDTKPGHTSKQTLYHDAINKLDDLILHPPMIPVDAATAKSTIENTYKNDYIGSGGTRMGDDDLLNISNDSTARQIQNLGFVEQMRKIELEINADVKDPTYDPSLNMIDVDLDDIDLNLPPDMNPHLPPVGPDWLAMAETNRNRTFENYDLSGMNMDEFLKQDIGSSDELKKINLQTNMKSILNDFARANYRAVVRNPLYKKFVEQLIKNVAYKRLYKYKIKNPKADKQEMASYFLKEYRALAKTFLERMHFAVNEHNKKLKEKIAQVSKYKNTNKGLSDIDRFDQYTDIFGEIHKRYINRYMAGLFLVTYDTSSVKEIAGKTSQKNPGRKARKSASTYKARKYRNKDINEVYKKW
ncbi:MAG: hypothetical protein JXA66_06380 [Oligoflexia bacterium]|nr:hypothetical protein [Oligoflexia bacterium]